MSSCVLNDPLLTRRMNVAEKLSNHPFFYVCHLKTNVSDQLPSKNSTKDFPMMPKLSQEVVPHQHVIVLMETDTRCS